MYRQSSFFSTERQRNFNDMLAWNEIARVKGFSQPSVTVTTLLSTLINFPQMLFISNNTGFVGKGNSVTFSVIEHRTGSNNTARISELVQKQIVSLHVSHCSPTTRSR